MFVLYYFTRNVGISMNKSPNQYVLGIWYTAAAYSMWGFLPLYWKLMESVPASEILAHRIVWSFVFIFILLALTSKWDYFKIECKNLFSNPSQLLGVLFASLLISANWFIYIWAVNEEKVIEASLGYYINPLISVMLGIIVLKEKLTIWQGIAVVLATIGVLIITLKYGEVPWIALSLALSFGLYGLAKKLTKLGSILGLTFETLLVVPVAFIYLSLLHVEGSGAIGNSSFYFLFILMGAGIATAIPLLCFAQGASRIPLSMIGFLQYIAPTISLLLGVFVFQETFTKTHMISFIFIWTALVLYSVSKTKYMLLIETKLTRPKKSFEV